MQDHTYAPSLLGPLVDNNDSMSLAPMSHSALSLKDPLWITAALHSLLKYTAQ